MSNLFYHKELNDAQGNKIKFLFQRIVKVNATEKYPPLATLRR